MGKNMADYKDESSSRAFSYHEFPCKITLKFAKQQVSHKKTLILQSNFMFIW